LVGGDDLAPCGIFATLTPKDTFTLTLKDEGSAASSLVPLPADTTIEIKDKGIVWDGLKGTRFKNDDKSKQWADVEEERFIDWMKQPMTPNFSHLVGVISSDLKEGHYLMQITNGKSYSLFQS
jgi:hypothetical protein